MIKETLRFGSPAAANARYHHELVLTNKLFADNNLPCLRVLEQDLEVGGHLVPGGTVAVLCHMTMAHNPEVQIY